MKQYQINAKPNPQIKKLNPQKQNALDSLILAIAAVPQQAAQK
jgi:hypothetical protein